MRHILPSVYQFLTVIPIILNIRISGIDLSYHSANQLIREQAYNIKMKVFI